MYSRCNINEIHVDDSVFIVTNATIGLIDQLVSLKVGDAVI